MTEDQVQELIKDYLRQHLEVVVIEDGYFTIMVKLKLAGETISSDSFSINLN